MSQIKTKCFTKSGTDTSRTSKCEYIYIYINSFFFIYHRDKCQIFMEGYLYDFIMEKGEFILEKDLKESLLLHLICLFDYGQIDKTVFLKATEKLLEIENKLNESESN